MSGVESIGSAGFSNAVPPVAHTGGGPSATNQDNKPAGMEGALKMAVDFLKQTMTEVGFVDVHAGAMDQLKVFVKQASTPAPETGGDLDPFLGAEIAARIGAQITGDGNQALRILAQVDPGRAATLLK